MKNSIQRLSKKDMKEIRGGFDGPACYDACYPGSTTGPMACPSTQSCRRFRCDFDDQEYFRCEGPVIIIGP